MEIKLSDFVADYLAQNGIKHVFTVVGGGAMHLNDSFGNHPDIKCIYNHHEQGSALCSEGYARINNDIAVTCVTTGPGGTNAITGVLCAWQDSIPMLVISGQTRLSTTVASTGLKLRQFGEQEHYIIDTVKNITKYSVMIDNPNEIKYHLDKALFEAQNGRKGPCWIDIPLDIQNTIINAEELVSYCQPSKDCINNSVITEIINSVKVAKSPVIIAGSSVRTSGKLNEFYELAKKMNVPVVCPTSISDYYTPDDDLYYGNFGVFGGRAGNFIIQNADLIISFGARMSFKQIGFNYENFSPKSKKIIIDIDESELSKNTLKIDVPIKADVSYIIEKLNKDITDPLEIKKEWKAYCDKLKKDFQYDIEDYIDSTNVNPYFFGCKMHEKLDEGDIIVVGNSCSSVSILQMGIHKKNQRIFGNVNCGTMGYDIPASIGASVAAGKSVYCVTGDGSFQMNLQELQTIVHNNIPVKLIVFNNYGYNAIVQSQTNFFDGRLSGCTHNSGISMPSFEKLAYAYGLPYYKVEKNNDVEAGIEWMTDQDSYCLLEVIQDNEQQIEPKVKSKIDSNGKIFSPPINDLSPFLSEEEYDEYSKF